VTALRLHNGAWQVSGMVAGFGRRMSLITERGYNMTYSELCNIERSGALSAAVRVTRNRGK
jgi:hypothetical protein